MYALRTRWKIRITKKLNQKEIQASETLGLSCAGRRQSKATTGHETRSFQSAAEQIEPPTVITHI